MKEYQILDNHGENYKLVTLNFSEGTEYNLFKKEQLLLSVKDDGNGFVFDKGFKKNMGYSEACYLRMVLNAIKHIDPLMFDSYQMCENVVSL